ncbi:MAG: hypothetical protein AAGC60_17715 [Acidobacteriota bacterium]
MLETQLVRLLLTLQRGESEDSAARGLMRLAQRAREPHGTARLFRVSLAAIERRRRREPLWPLVRPQGT